MFGTRPHEAFGIGGYRWAVLAVWSAPFRSLFVDVGVALDAAKISLIAVALIRVLVHRPLRIESTGRNLFVAAFVYSLLVTVIMTSGAPENVNGSQAIFRNPSTRWIVQLVAQYLDLILFFVAFEAGVAGESLIRLLRHACHAILVLSTIGGLQIVAHFTGLLEMQIFTISEEFRRPAYFLAGGVMVPRVSSLGGEPKHLAASILPVMLMVLVIWLSKATLLMRRLAVHGAGLAIIASIFAFTFSTGTYFGLACAFPFVAIYTWNSLSGVAKVQIASGVLLAVVAALYISVPSIASDIVQARITDRIGAMDYPEQALLAFLSDKPSYCLTGVGAGNIGFYTADYLNLNQDTARYLLNSTLPLASKALTILGETGLFGLMLALGGQAAVLVGGNAALRLKQSAESRTLMIALMCGCLGCMSLQLFSQAPYTNLFFGGLAGLISSTKTRTRTA